MFQQIPQAFVTISVLYILHAIQKNIFFVSENKIFLKLDEI